MGKVRKDIRLLSKEAGGKLRARMDAEAWFESSKKAIREKAVSADGRPFVPGKIYVFRYNNPVSAYWWDSNPVVLALDPPNAPGNDMGINLNMLPVAVKEDLLDFIYDQYEQYINGQTRGNKLENARAQAGLPSFSYDGAKAFLQRYGFDFAIRQYKRNRKGNQVIVSYENWAKIVLCDFIELNGSTIGQIRAMFRNHLNK